MTETEPQPVLEKIDPADVLRGRDILCFSHDWSGDPLSKTHLMRLLARDNRILWVNSIGYRTPTASRADLGRAFRKLKSAAVQPIREVEPNTSSFSTPWRSCPPTAGRRSGQRPNRRLLAGQVRRAMRRLRFRRPINWVFNPAAARSSPATSARSRSFTIASTNTRPSPVSPRGP